MNKRQIGGEFEKQAANYIKKRGMSILEMNFRNRGGEIDIIAKDGEYICFIEVKYRTTNQWGSPLEAVNYRKQQQIRKVALYYMMRHGLHEWTPCRFDVIAFEGDRITHIENAF